MRLMTIAVPLASLSPASMATSASAHQSAAEPAQAALDELIAADRRFGSNSGDPSLVEAIGAMLEDEVMMPLPGQCFARDKTAVLAALKANPANLDAKAQWAPVRGGISADGTHAFTYGFMTIRADGKPDRLAKYLAYWVKGPAGWRVAAYKRAGRPEGPVSTALRPAALPAAIGVPPPDTQHHQASLIAAEKAFSDRAQQVGLGAAFREFGSADAMNMGAGADFTYGNDAIAAGMGPDTVSPLHWAADAGALVAPSGDLGVTFGHIRPNGPPPEGQPSEIPFFTIWRKASPEAPWRYVAE